jgi:aminoglycoside phosphotransferase (APT) family kinase protein
MSAAVDRACAMREEDRLDVDAVDGFLKQHVAGLEGRPQIHQFPGGASNLTYLVRYAARDLVLRRPPMGAKARSAHDVLRESRVMAAIRPHYPYVPDILARNDDPALLGCPFFVMERLRGIILRRDLPHDLGLDAADVQPLCQGFVDRLVELHQVDATDGEVASLGHGEGYIARQVSGWGERWRQALTEGTEPCEGLLAWLAQKQPGTETAICVIHNDYRLDNVVLDPAQPLQITGVLDWELATLGDPLMDLGGALAYWVQADDDATFRSFRLQPSHVPGMLGRRQMVDYYSQRSGWAIDNFDFYEVFGLFRLMVIIQQIYRRFVLGQTSNPRFAGFGDAVAYLGQRCRRLVAASDL